MEMKPVIFTSGTRTSGVLEASGSAVPGLVKTGGVGLRKSGMAVFVVSPIMVGVTVKVGEGTVGVKVGATVGVLATVGADKGGGVGCPPKASAQAESRNRDSKGNRIFFISKNLFKFQRARLKSHAGRK